MALVRRDQRGLFVIAGGYVARPGAVRGYEHALRMDAAGLREGDKVRARHMASSPLTKVVLGDGQTVYWHHEGVERDRNATSDDPPTDYDKQGKRIFRK
jgi:hypothetical protein